MFYLYSVPGVTFSSNFLHAVTFLHVLHLDVIKRQIEIETVTFSSNSLHAVTFLHVLHLDVIKRQIEIETESKTPYVWL